MDRLACDRMFAAVMEAGSFVAAAERLGTISGQASKLVSRLETELGVHLLNRTMRAISPTEAGQAYTSVCGRSSRSSTTSIFQFAISPRRRRGGCVSPRRSPSARWS